ncbi:MarR family winged helix-turn-helix transcriptional regulator [Promicromonospora sp. NPDC019610]|uniref:MarR family winged helix-turn-helix transcriptional regulator n=1 Tax=Promicromonospora sp. NPDC019610 TaxID=3364405 RepID=UPI00378D6071
MVENVDWLDADEVRTWRALHAVLVVLPAALDAQLQRDAGLTYLEYYVLAGLTDAQSGRRRLSELAILTNAELSRISHLVARLEKRGLVERHTDPDDARATNAVLTEAGRAKIEEAAPGHVAMVRELVFDRLGDTGRQGLKNASSSIVAALSASDLPLAPSIRKALRETR